MKLAKNQQGLATFELILVVVIVAAIAVAGVRVLNASEDSSTDSTASAKQSDGVSTAPTINSKDDLTKAEATLDQNDPESANSSDTRQLDSQLSAY